MSTGQTNLRVAAGEIAFEMRDFYLASFLRCTGYDLIDLRAEAPAEGLRFSRPPDAAR